MPTLARRKVPEFERIRTGVHVWFCGSSYNHDLDAPHRPDDGWICERGAKVILREYEASDPLYEDGNVPPEAIR